MEMWKSIPEFDGYEISSHGRVYSKAREVKRGTGTLKIQGKMLKPSTLKKCGHRYVNLRKDGKYTSMYVHRLVALAFIGDPPDGKPQVAHWDGDPSNNNLSNLRWVSAKENSQDAIRLGRSVRPSGTERNESAFSKEDIRQIFEMKRSGKSNRSIAAVFQVAHSTISEIINRKRYKNEIMKMGL
jgi:hypothetical protein